MWKKTLAVIAGLFAAFIVMYVFEGISHLIFPPSEYIDSNNPDQLQEIMKKAPFGSLLIVLFGFAAGSFAGGVIASVSSKNFNTNLAMVVGSILMVAGIINMLIISHPVWFMILNLFMYLPFAYLGGKLIKTRTGKQY